MNIRHKSGYKSKKKLKKRISATNIIEPGNPKNISRLTRLTRKSLGHKKFTPLISVIKRVLNRLPIASTSKKEFVDRRAWLISIQKPASIKEACPLTIQIVSQCISTTVEYATSFLRSIW
jgi:acetolactate synthase small subunit